MAVINSRRSRRGCRPETKHCAIPLLFSIQKCRYVLWDDIQKHFSLLVIPHVPLAVVVVISHVFACWGNIREDGRISFLYFFNKMSLLVLGSGNSKLIFTTSHFIQQLFPSPILWINCYLMNHPKRVLKLFGKNKDLF